MILGNKQLMGAGGKVRGEIIHLSSGTWVVPYGVNSISVVCIQSGYNGGNDSGGNGGNLRARNNIPVVPGETLTVTVGGLGSNGQHSILQRGATTLCGSNESLSSVDVWGQGGLGGPDNGTVSTPYGNLKNTGGGGGGPAWNFASGGDGNGGDADTNGGGGGAGGAGIGSAGGPVGTAPNDFYYASSGGGGGGVGLFGEGYVGPGALGGSSEQGGSGGTGGQDGENGGIGSASGGAYGGGGGGAWQYVYQNGVVLYSRGNGGPGAMRIIWPGDERSFPSTDVGLTE